MTSEERIVTLKDDGEFWDKKPDGVVVLDGWFDYEPAPPKDFLPMCHGFGMMCGGHTYSGPQCEVCPYRKRD
jgi:hypothetical protein